MKKQDKNTKRLVGGIIAIVIIIALLILIFNPELIPFLSDEARAKLQTMLANNFGSIINSEASFKLEPLIALVIMAAILGVSYVVFKFVLTVIKVKTRKGETVKQMLINALKYVVVIVAIVWGLSILGVNMVAIIAGVGIVGMVIGFGAQSLIEDIFTGVFLVFEGQFCVGDIVSIDNFRGKVVTIGIRTTTLEDAGGNLKIINNSDIRNVNNLSNETSIAICDISIAYSQSIEKAEEVIQKTSEEILEKYPHIFLGKPEYLGVQSLSSSSVDLRMMAKCEENEIFHARRLLNREFKLAFDKNGIEIPFPQLVVYDGDKNKDQTK